MSEASAADLSAPLEKLDAALAKLRTAAPFAKSNHIGRVLDVVDRVLQKPGGAAAVYARAAALDDAGVFAGGDWDSPARLQPAFAPASLKSEDRRIATMECLNLLRLLAIAEGIHARSGVSAEQAGRHLREVLALSLEYVFERRTEAGRAADARNAGPRQVMGLVAETIGYDTLLDQLVAEIWRLLRQRPIQVGPVRDMIGKLSVYCYGPEHEDLNMPMGAERLISALYSPSPASTGDPGLDVYAGRLARLDSNALQEEAGACARAMHDTGLVSPYHAVLVRHLLGAAPDLLSVVLGLSTTGLDGALTYRDLVHALIEKAVYPETCQCLYGLSALLERAVLHNPGVAASLWRQIKLPLTETTRARLAATCGVVRPPEVHLLAGVISILGQPLGVGQGNNPTCQSARALSLWAYSDPDYLLQLLAWAARDDGVLMTFRGRQISSAFLPDGAAGLVGRDLDAVSTVLVPHLDRVYAEMGRLAGELGGEDPHIHVNPEFHGWRVGRGFAIAVDVASGQLADYEDFVRLFFACFHPAFNGGQPVIHPQPVGLAVTDSHARFVGWHAVTLLRVAIDQSGATRVYFFNPNNDGGQDWGDGVVVSTEGNGEAYGESSLPIAEFASRLYLFHYDLLEVGSRTAVPAGEIQEVMRLGAPSWAAARVPPAAVATPSD